MSDCNVQENAFYIWSVNEANVMVTWMTFCSKMNALFSFFGFKQPLNLVTVESALDKTLSKEVVLPNNRIGNNFKVTAIHWPQ